MTRSAEQLGVTMQTDAEVRAIAEVAVRRVENTFDRMLRAGELRDLNRRYRAHRLARAAEGKGAQSYRAWLANQKLAMVRSTAAIVARSRAAWPGINPYPSLAG